MEDEQLTLKDELVSCLSGWVCGCSGRVYYLLEQI